MKASSPSQSRAERTKFEFFAVFAFREPSQAFSHLTPRMTLILTNNQPFRMGISPGPLEQPEKLDDAALVALARSAKSPSERDAAFDELVRRYAPRLHAVASRIVGREEAFDVVQDGFLNAYRAMGHFREEAQFSTWVHRIVLNCAYASLRRNPNARNDLEVPVEVISDQVTPLEVAENRDLRSALERALQQIKPEFRETFTLVEFGGLDYAGVAEVLEVQVGTVKSRMSRAREALRGILEAEGFRP
jgi:RNA polymerase sigma-70 factor, ECF subfamily